jgi:hypothetical protein
VQQHCHMPLWQDVTEEQATALQKLLRLRGSAPYHNDHLCRDISENGACASAKNLTLLSLLTFGFLVATGLSGRVRNGNSSITTALVITCSTLIGIWKIFATWKLWNLRPVDGADAASLAHQYYPSPDSYSILGDLASSTAALQSNTNCDRQKAPQPSGSSGIEIGLDQSVSAYGVNITAEEQSWILFGVRGHFEYFEIDHLDTRPSKIKNDDDLFRVLRASHAQLKRLFRRLFSVWQLSHCDIIKVSYDGHHGFRVRDDKLTFQVLKAGGESYLPRH